MNLKILPKNLHHLVPIVQKWGINDDDLRSELILNSPDSELYLLVNSIDDTDSDNLDDWFTSESFIKNPLSEEVIMFSCFIMAFDYANVILNKRKN
jgi:hypothetical protein